MAAAQNGSAGSPTHRKQAGGGFYQEKKKGGRSDGNGDGWWAFGGKEEGGAEEGWGARVMAVKGLDDVSGAGYDSTLAAAIVYAVDNGADVINASWGRRGISEGLDAAVEDAFSHGVVFVAGAGNSASDVSTFYPANFARAIAVSAFDPTDGKATFSNYGTRLDAGAPGFDILSLLATGVRVGNPINTNYTRASGTSMAAPHVAGV